MVNDRNRKKIYNEIRDPKGIQGNLNTLDWTDQNKISNRAYSDMLKAQQARAYEQERDHESSIDLWAEIFGSKFPVYEKV